MQIRHLYFLIHPGCYETLSRISPERIVRENLGLFVELEREVTSRWREALASSPQDTLLLQLYGSTDFLAEARSIVGERRVCFMRAEFPGPDQMAEYYARLSACVGEHLDRFGLTMDPATVTSEFWGESFEGCVAGYGSAFAHQLGLKRPPKMRFEMTVFDSRFLHQSLQHEFLPVDGTDVEACLFELHDHSPAATFQSRLHPQWLDNRTVQLELAPSQAQVCTKTGHTLWPPTPTAPKIGRETKQTQSFTLKDGHWLRSAVMSYDNFRDAILSAKVRCPSSASTQPTAMAGAI